MRSNCHLCVCVWHTCYVAFLLKRIWECNTFISRAAKKRVLVRREISNRVFVFGWYFFFLLQTCSCSAKFELHRFCLAQHETKYERLFKGSEKVLGTSCSHHIAITCNLQVLLLKWYLPHSPSFLQLLLNGTYDYVRHKILYVFLDHFPDGGRQDGWIADDYLRTFLTHNGMSRVVGARSDDVFVINDADEIPALDGLLFLKLFDGWTEPFAIHMRKVPAVFLCVRMSASFSNKKSLLTWLYF